MQIWLISDTHFGHDNMYKFVTFDRTHRVRERFSSAKEGDEYMIDAWNSLVSPQDHVYHLGDYALKVPRSAYIAIGKKLNGHKRLVLGNHDRETMQVYRDSGFQKIFGMRRLESLWLTHAPLHPMQLGEKVLGNVHGHIHERDSPPGKYFNVSVEKINYQPIPLDEVVAFFKRTE